MADMGPIMPIIGIIAASGSMLDAICAAELEPVFAPDEVRPVSERSCVKPVEPVFEPTAPVLLVVAVVS